MKRWGPSIRWWLLGANALVLAVPIVALAGLRIYDVFLLRQTERQLLAQSVVVGEAYRDAWRLESGRPHDQHRPPGRAAERYTPVEPVLDLGLEQVPATPETLPGRETSDTAFTRAGVRLEPLMRRAQTFNLSALRVLDPSGCVVATTRAQAGLCLGQLPEVKAAMLGRYHAVARARVSDEPTPPLGDIRRRGKTRVFTALPVFSNGRIIGIVRASRTGLDALSSLWTNRRGLLWLALASFALSACVSFLFSWAIARPLRRLTAGARRIAHGQRQAALASSGLTPAEIGELNDVFEHMTRKLNQRADYVGELASNLSHELKSPITAVRGAAELLREQGSRMPEAQRARFADNIEADAARLERLLARLLTLARLENPREQAAEPLDVARTVRSVLRRYTEQVQWLDSDPAPPLAIREEHVESVVVNLVDNALRHGEGKPIQVRVYAAGARVCIEVVDHGCGISEANRKRLFERFFTTARDSGGTGLGLAIVKAIAEQRGGSVQVHSDRNGSTFRVLL
ncbi:MAG: ATP-binding protein [Proteobacteria bacterium]|nr:ATP-binding protein [Pseudomonadota bacterium]